MNRLRYYLIELREQLQEKSRPFESAKVGRQLGNPTEGEEESRDVVTLNITGRANPPSPASIRCETGGEAEEIITRLSCVLAFPEKTAPEPSQLVRLDSL